jgi:uncharacterized membrane protein YbhN (UPF0104 family)
MDRLSWLRIVSCILALAGCALLLRGIEIDRLLGALNGAAWAWVLLAAAINMTINLAARIGRWSALLAPLPHQRAPTRMELAHVMLASGALSNLLPGRAGEGLRTIALSKRNGFPLTSVIASQLLEKLVEATSLLVIAVLTAFALDLPPAIHTAALCLALLACAGLAIVVVIGRRSGSASEGSWLGRFGEAARSARSPRVWLMSLGWSLASDLVDVAMIGLCLLAVGVSISPFAWCATYLAINLAIAVPTTPGQVGVLEAAAALVLSALGVEAERALAFAVLYHAAHLVPTTLAGLYSMSGLSALRIADGATR